MGRFQSFTLITGRFTWNGTQLKARHDYSKLAQHILLYKPNCFTFFLYILSFWHLQMHLCFGRFHFHKRWYLLIESSVMNVSSHFVLLICIHLKDRPLILILVKSALTTRLICIFVQWLLKILTTNTPNSNEINWKIRFVVPPFFFTPGSTGRYWPKE